MGGARPARAGGRAGFAPVCEVAEHAVHDEAGGGKGAGGDEEAVARVEACGVGVRGGEVQAEDAPRAAEGGEGGHEKATDASAADAWVHRHAHELTLVLIDALDLLACAEFVCRVLHGSRRVEQVTSGSPRCIQLLHPARWTRRPKSCFLRSSGIRARSHP